MFVRNLRLSAQFSIVGLLALLCALVPSALMVRSELRNVEVASQEAGGIPPALAALALVQLTQKHRGSSAGFLAGNDALRAEREARATEAEQTLERLRTALQQAGYAAQLPALEKVSAAWKALAGDVAARRIKGPDSFARHTALLADQLALLDAVLDVSGMMLDPETATYYLIQATFVHLPMLTEALGQARGRGVGLITRGEIGALDRAQMAALADRARSAQQQAQAALTKAAAADAGLQRAARPIIDEGAKAAGAAIELVERQLVQAERPTMAPPDYYRETTAHIDAQFKIAEAASSTLRTLLDDRVVDSRRQMGVTLAALLLLGGVGFALGWVIVRTMLRSVREAVEVAHRVASGDLTGAIVVSGRDEMADLLRAMKDMQERLVDVVGLVRGNAQSVATASMQIAQGNHDLSSRTEEQAASLEQTAATMDQLGSTVRNNADNARQADQLAQSASEVAQRGGSVVADVVQTMHRIDEAARRIAEITGTIDGIAFQTNILALNAAVEAARAGEHGRGFAVVAGEVRGLAQRAAGAAREIKSLIGASVERVEQGSVQADRAGETMHEVVAAIKRVSDIVAEISHASSEQANGVVQVGQAVSQMDQVTQQNSALVEESAAAAESLRQQAARLVDAVAVFRLTLQRG